MQAGDVRLTALDREVLAAAEASGVPEGDELAVNRLARDTGRPRESVGSAVRRLKAAGLWRWADVERGVARLIADDAAERLERARRLASDPGHLRAARLSAHKAVRRTGMKWVAEDLESAALFGLWEAALSFDPDRGNTFKTYLAHRVRGAILDEFRRLNAHGYGAAGGAIRRGEAVKAPRSLATVLGVSERGREYTLGDAIPDDRAPGPDAGIASRQGFEALIKALPGRSRAAFRMLYVEGATMAATAAFVGLTESRISQMHSRALETIREAEANRRGASA